MQGWSREEVEAVVADYFDMLTHELSGRSYSKTEHRRRLLPFLHNRSAASVEFKHQNITAVLNDMGYPGIVGYQPLGNYQQLLYEVVAERIAADNRTKALVAADVELTVPVPSVEDILKALTEPPKSQRHAGTAREGSLSYLPQPINYLEREASNRILGKAGEQFVINFEKARLAFLGLEGLADKIEHTSEVRGDGTGFDIISFEESGAERFIEVKTTKYGKETPFFVSCNELDASTRSAAQYHLYRVFEFRASPKLFMLPGCLSKTCRLSPTSFIAAVA